MSKISIMLIWSAFMHLNKTHIANEREKCGHFMLISNKLAKTFFSRSFFDFSRSMNNFGSSKNGANALLKCCKEGYVLFESN